MIARLVAAGVIGLIAAVAAVGALVAARSPVTAFEWSVRPREVASVSSALVLITRDGASDARFSADTWDRAVLARVVTALARAGAAAIGIDVSLGLPGAPGRGGPTGDALLSQATALAGNVVFAIVPGEPVPALAQHARSVGHTLAPPDPDGVVRRIPVRAGVVDRSVPAWGLALVAAAREAVLDAIPVDRDGRALMTFTPLLPTLTFSDVWTAIDQGQRDRLQGLVDGKIVLLLLDPGSIERRTPVGLLSEGAIQAQVANAALTSSWRRDVPLTWTALAALVVATAVAWAFLTLRWWQAAGALVVVVAGYQAALHVVPQRTGVLLPIFVPLAAAGVAGAVAVVWRQICAFRRLRLVEGDVHAIRQALVRQESTVESLEEDLEAARAAVARSTGTERELLRAVEALRAQVAEAQSQEEATRRRLRELEGDGRVEPTAGRLSDVERQRLVERCAELGIITRDPDVLALFGDLERAAPSSLPILIGGEPGTGKELFARAAHTLSPRCDQPFVAVNMAAIPPELFESELFGHVKGSFTGAVGERRGYFEQADRGTLFLDEIGELRADHQGKLLRVLQEKTFYKVGATRPVSVDVRIVAASNRDLERGVAEGWFREDLYFRLKGLVLRLPPLRDRRHDIAPLATQLLEQAGAEAGRSVTLSDAAVLALQRYPWPGNVRELRHCLEQAVALASGPMLGVEDLRLPTKSAAGTTATDDSAVLSCLRRHGFDMQATARALGWDRSTVTQRLKGLGFAALVDAGGDRGKAALALAGEARLVRAVEVKLAEYHEHLLRAVEGFASAEAAIAACRRRFKNLPDRHFRSLESLVRKKFE